MDNPGKEQKYLPWLRWVCYSFLVVGFGLTFFHDQFSDSTHLPVLLLQILAFVTLIIGIGLFLLVREPNSFDRASAYRDVFGKDDTPLGEPPAPENRTE